MTSTVDLDRFLQAHRLPESFRRTAEDHYLAVADWLGDRFTPGRTFLLGINGAQGTGKSTLADLIKLALETTKDMRVAVLSIDDFYLTKAEREALAHERHELFATRGVPGTHDVAMLRSTLDSLRSLGSGDVYHLPRFDKARDDRAVATDWPAVAGPLDAVILEGWCVGSGAQADIELASPINDLERRHDRDGRWRQYVNERLATDYAEVFAQLDALVFLEAPGFDTVYRWRLKQEQKLAATNPADASGIMDELQVAAFIQHYERITRSNLEHMAGSADVVLVLDEFHRCVASHYNTE